MVEKYVQPDDQKFTNDQAKAMHDALQGKVHTPFETAQATNSEKDLPADDPNAKYEPEGPGKDIEQHDIDRDIESAA